MATLSLCMIVKDEEEFLKDCIACVKDIVDEIVIGVDTRSKDSTKKIAEELGNSVFDIKWEDDFSKARNLTLQKATSNWILVLDADELIDEDGKKELLKLINNKENCLADIIGFTLDQRTYQPKDGAIKTTDKSLLKENFTGHTSSMLVRLFKNNSKIRFANKVHELVEKSIRDNKGTITPTNIVIHHFSMLKGKEAHKSKTGNYIDLIWKQLEKEPANPRYNHQAAEAFLQCGRKDLALKYFLRTLKFDPNFKMIYADIAKLQLEMGKVQDSIKFFNMAILMDKKDTSSMNNLAFIYMTMKKYDTAKELLEKAIDIDPKNSILKEHYKMLKEKMK
jgi:glycosyltransferase involved in cell wall biosynthesis